MSSPEASANSANRGLGWQQSIRRWKTDDCRIISKPFLTPSHKNVPSKVNKLWKLCLAVYRLLFFFCSSLVSSRLFLSHLFHLLWQNRCYALIAYKTQTRDPPVNTGRERCQQKTPAFVRNSSFPLIHLFFFPFLPSKVLVTVSSYVKKKKFSQLRLHPRSLFFFHLLHLETCWETKILRSHLQREQLDGEGDGCEWRTLYPHFCPQ